MSDMGIFTTDARQDPSADLNLTPLVPYVAPETPATPPPSFAAAMASLDPQTVLPIPTAQSSPLIGLSGGAGARARAQLDAATNAPTRGIVSGINTLADFFHPRGSSMPRVDPNYQKNLTALFNKYTELAPVYQQLSPTQRAALLQLDSDRVYRGAPGMSKRETLNAVQMLMTGRETTPDKGRSPWHFFRNTAADLGGLVKALNPLTLGRTLAGEAGDILSGNFNYGDLRSSGVNPVTAFLRQPGIRLAPGAWTVGNVLGGREGIREAVTHPLITGLDVLPYAGRAAAATRVGQAGAEIAEAAGVRPRPLREVLFYRAPTNEDGTLVRAGQEAPLPRGVAEVERDVMYKGRRVAPTEAQLEANPAGLPILQRNAFGQLVRSHVFDSKLGQSVSTMGGYLSRRESIAQNEASAKIRALQGDIIDPVTPQEKLVSDVGKWARRWEEDPRVPEGFSLPEGRRTPAQQAANRDFLARMERGDYEGIPEDFVSEYNSLVDRAAKLSPDDLSQFDGEWLTADQVAQLRTSEQAVKSAQFRNEVGQHLDEPNFDGATASRWVDELNNVDTRFASKADTAAQARLLIQALENRGVDMTTKDRFKMSPRDYVAVMYRAPRAEQGWRLHGVVEAILQRMNDHSTRMREMFGSDADLGPAIRTSTEVLDDLRAVEKANRISLKRAPTGAERLRAERIVRTITRLRDGFKAPNPLYLTEAIKSLGRNIDDLDPKLVNDMVVARARIAGAKKYKGLVPSESRVARFVKTHESLRDKTTPARFTPLLSDIAHEQLVERLVTQLDENRSMDSPTPLPKDLETKSPAFQRQVDEAMAKVRSGEINVRNVTPAEAGHLALMALEGRYKNMGFDEQFVVDRMNEIQSDVSRTWRTLREEGFNPAYVHRVSARRANELFHPSADPVPTAPTQFKVRQLDVTPRIDDLQVSLSHQAVEVLQKTYAEDLIDHIAADIGIEGSQLRDTFTPEARWQYERNPSKNFDQHLEDAIGRGYRRLDPREAGFAWGGTRLNKYQNGDIWIPRPVADNLKFYGKTISPVTHLMDKVNNFFRFNVIGLSPQVTLNNFMSNLVAATAEQGPGVLLQFPKAWRMMKDPDAYRGSAELRTLGARQSQEFHAFPGVHEVLQSKNMYKKFARAKFFQSVNARRAFDKSVAAGADQATARLPLAERAVERTKRIAQKNIDLQIMGDQVVRNMIGLHALERATKKGITGSAREAAMVKAIDDSIINYMSFTAIERNAMRTIIPFYSYASFAARFAMRYPFDHPWRMAILASVARIANDDLAGMPGSYMGFVPIPDWVPFLGGKGSSGAQNFLSTRAFDPFSGVADMSSVAGWISQTGPLPQALLSELGIERGEQDLFPTMEWNPDTGRMEAIQDQGFFGNLFAGTAPRLQFALTPLGLNAKYNRLRDEHPDAATRSLLSGVGLPTLWTRRNPIIDAVNAESNRSESQAQVLNRALKSGDWSNADLYPGLGPQKQQLKDLAENYPEFVSLFQNASPEQIQAWLGQTTGVRGG